MSDTKDPTASLSRDDLLHIIKHDQFVKEQLSARVGLLMKENLELLAIVQDRNTAPNGEVPHPEVPTDVTS